MKTLSHFFHHRGIEVLRHTEALTTPTLTPIPTLTYSFII
jgi:hypothetical protein